MQFWLKCLYQTNFKHYIDIKIGQVKKLSRPNIKIDQITEIVGIKYLNYLLNILKCNSIGS